MCPGTKFGGTPEGREGGGIPGIIPGGGTLIGMLPGIRSGIIGSPPIGGGGNAMTTYSDEISLRFLRRYKYTQDPASRETRGTASVSKLLDAVQLDPPPHPSSAIYPDKMRRSSSLLVRSISPSMRITFIYSFIFIYLLLLLHYPIPVTIYYYTYYHRYQQHNALLLQPECSCACP